MRLLATFAAVCAVFMMTGQASAQPFNPGELLDKAAGAGVGDDRIIKTTGCHGNYKTHFVPRWGYTATHRHQGNNCWPKHPQGSGPGFVSHCHQKVRKHFHGNFNKPRWHRHVGPNCWPKRSKKFKYKPGFGGCFKAGPVWICP